MENVQSNYTLYTALTKLINYYLTFLKFTFTEPFSCPVFTLVGIEFKSKNSRITGFGSNTNFHITNHKIATTARIVNTLKIKYPTS